jgi:hypothetical protein
MKTEKNVLMLDSMSKNQMSPGLCDPREFEVIEADTPFHGQCGNNDAEYQRLLRQGAEAANASDFSEQGEEHPNVNDSGPAHTAGIGRE